MATQHYSNNRDRDNRGRHVERLTIEQQAEKYLPDIQLLLDPSAHAEHVKKGVSKIEELIKAIDSNRGEKMTTHQIRNIYKLIKDAQKPRDLHLLRPRLAYVAARQKDEHGKVIAKVIDMLIVAATSGSDEQLQQTRINMLSYIVESMVAYHKFYVKE